MKAALLALTLSILSIMPAHATKWIELAEAQPGGVILQRGVCTVEEPKEAVYCVEFVLEGKRYLAALDKAEPTANILQIFTRPNERYPDGKVPVQDLLDAGSI